MGFSNPAKYYNNCEEIDVKMINLLTFNMVVYYLTVLRENNL
jgi:hypothetical protein